MNAQDAIAKLNSVGGKAGSLSGGDFYEVFRALQGSFTYADEFNKMLATVSDPAFKPKFAAADVQDKILKDINVNNTNLEKLSNDYQVAALFDVHHAVRNKFASRAFEFLQNYNTIGIFSPEDLDDLEKVSKTLKEDMDKNVVNFSPKDKKFVDTFIAKVEKEEEAFVLANGLDKLDTIPANQIDDNLANLDRIEQELLTDTGVYAEEDKKISSMFEAVEIEPASEDDQLDPLSSREFRIQAYDLAAEAAKARCASDPTFNALPEHEKKLSYLKAKEEAAEDFIRETLIAQAAFVAGKSYNGGGTVTAKDKKEFKKAANAAIADLKKNIKKGDGSAAPIKVNKNVALFALGTGEKKNFAVAKYIAKKTKSVKFLERAKAKLQKFKEEHPKTTSFMEKYGSAVTKGGLVLGANMLFSPAGGALSAYFAVTSARKSYKDLKAKYKADKAYEGKKFGQYLKDHKLEATVTIATGVAGGVAAAFGVAGIASAAGAFNYDVAVRRVVRGSASLGVGLASGVNQLVKAKDKKEKRRAWKQMGLSAGIAAVSLFFADDIAKNAPGALKGGVDWMKDKLGFGSGNEEVNSIIADNNIISTLETPSAEPEINTDVKGDTIYTDGEKSYNPKLFDPNDPEYNQSLADDSQIKILPMEETQTVDDLADSKYVNIKLAHDATNASLANGVTFDNEIGKLANGQDVISFSSMDSVWKNDQLKNFYFNIDSGDVESVPVGMSKEVYMHKLTQLIKLAPVVHKESIELALRDLKCEGTLLTKEEIMQVHSSLATIDKYGEYHGYEPTARTNNRIISLEANVECESENVNIKQGYTGGKTFERETTAAVAEEKEAINNNTFTFNYNEEKIVVEQKEPIVIKEPVVEQEEIPMAAPTPAPMSMAPAPVVSVPAEFNEIIESNQNFAQVATEKGWIFKDGKFEHVGTDKAFSYMNEIAEKQRDFAVKALRGGWGLELNDASFTSDEKLAGVYKAALEKGHVFVANENGELKTYMVKGGTFHTALYESNPEKYGESYSKAQQEIADFKARQSVSAQSSEEAATVNTQSSGQQKPFIINNGKGYGD